MKRAWSGTCLSPSRATTKLDEEDREEPMIGYAAERLGTRAKNLLLVTQAIVDRLPETIDGELVRCHEIARVVAELLSMSDDFGDLIVVDGKFGVHDHSWIRMDQDGRGCLILDPYAMGRIPMVQVIDLDAMMVPYRRESACDRCGAPNPWLYREGPVRDDVRHEVITALRSYLTWFKLRGVV